MVSGWRLFVSLDAVLCRSVCHVTLGKLPECARAARDIAVMGQREVGYSAPRIDSSGDVWMVSCAGPLGIFAFNGSVLCCFICGALCRDLAKISNLKRGKGCFQGLGLLLQAKRPDVHAPPAKLFFQSEQCAAIGAPTPGSVDH